MATADHLPPAPHEHHHHYHYYSHPAPHNVHTQWSFPFNLRLRNSMFPANVDPTNPPLYKLHPIYSLRWLVIVNALIGLLLAYIAYNSTGYWNQGIWAIGMTAMAPSAGLAIADLMFWVHEKLKEQNVCKVCLGECQRSVGGSEQRAEGGHQDEREGGQETLVEVDTGNIAAAETDLEQGFTTRKGKQPADGSSTLITPSSSSVSTPAPIPAPIQPPIQHNPNDAHPQPIRAKPDPPSKSFWPTTSLMIIEFFFVPAYLFLFAGEVTVTAEELENTNPYNIVPSMFSVYATISPLFAALLHAICWWKAFMEKKRQQWKNEERKQDEGRLRI